MWKWAMLVLLCVVGCDSSDFYRQDTRTWFGLENAPTADKAGQTPPTAKTDQAQR
jgi:hypothetical protein